MGLKVKPITESAIKLVQRAQAASGEYAKAAAASGDQWNTQTQASKAIFGQAVRAAGIEERFARGAARAGAAGYVEGVTKKGAGRFSEGVGLGQGKYAANTEPFFSTLAGLTLSARQPKGSPANYGRVAEVGKALNAKRLALLGSGG